MHAEIGCGNLTKNRIGNVIGDARAQCQVTVKPQTLKLITFESSSAYATQYISTLKLGYIEPLLDN